jgi:hypothetical protein
MKWQLIVAGARTAMFGMLFLAGTASAELRIMNDPGGEVSSYLRTFYEMRASGERIIIDVSRLEKACGRPLCSCAVNERWGWGYGREHSFIPQGRCDHSHSGQVW